MRHLLIAPALVLALGASEAHAETFNYTLSDSTTARAAADAKMSAASIRARLAGMGATVVASGNRVRVAGISEATAAKLVEPQGQLAIFDWEGSLVRSVIPKGKGCLVSTTSSAPAGVGRTTKSKAKARARSCKSGGEILHGPRGNGWYGLVRTTPITSQHVVNPRVGTDPVTGKPTIVFGLNKRGQSNFKFMTLLIARRGKREGVAGAHHFGYSIDRQLISTPFVDGDVAPAGLSAANGLQISGGFSRARAKTLVTLIKHPLAGRLRRAR